MVEVEDARFYNFLLEARHPSILATQLQVLETTINICLIKRHTEVREEVIQYFHTGTMICEESGQAIGKRYLKQIYSISTIHTGASVTKIAVVTYIRHSYRLAVNHIDLGSQNTASESPLHAIYIQVPPSRKHLTANSITYLVNHDGRQRR